MTTEQIQLPRLEFPDQSSELERLLIGTPYWTETEIEEMTADLNYDDDGCTTWNEEI